MKVLFTTRASLFAQPGGDTLQITQTAAALKDLGVDVTIKLRGETRDYDAYDLIHFFNIGRPADIIGDLHRINKPIIVSSIWVDYSEWEAQQGGLRAALINLLGKFAIEYIKTVGRAFANADYLPGWQYLRLGQKKSMQLIMSKAVRVIASSSSESNRLNKVFNTAPKTEVLTLGVQQELIGAPVQDREGVLCVGRIEGLKNQLHAIAAAKNAPWHLKIIGKPAVNQRKYYQKCRKAAGNNVSFLGWLLPEHLSQAYQEAKVLVLPSYFETFGLVALEALANGCRVVMSDRPDMNSIFKDRVLFCDPTDPEDIRRKIDEALKLPPVTLSEEDLAYFSWAQVAHQLLAIYKNILQS